MAAALAGPHGPGRPPGAIEFVFRPAEPPLREKSAEPSEQPTFFSELQEDRADIAPERADFLSNVDSRARDRIEGGMDTDLPRLQGESEAPHVAMQPEQEAPLAE